MISLFKSNLGASEVPSHQLSTYSQNGSNVFWTCRSIAPSFPSWVDSPHQKSFWGSQNQLHPKLLTHRRKKEKNLRWFFFAPLSKNAVLNRPGNIIFSSSINRIDVDRSTKTPVTSVFADGPLEKETRELIVGWCTRFVLGVPLRWGHCRIIRYYCYLGKFQTKNVLLGSICRIHYEYILVEL